MKRLPLLLLAVLVGCAPAAPRVRHATPFPARLALLPLNNLAVNMQGPILARHLLEAKLRRAGYALADAAVVDDRLRTLGVTDGGQLRAVDPRKIAESLGADALLYGDLLTFSNTNLGVYNHRAVEIRLRLVDPASGTDLWDSTRKETTTKLGLDKEAIRDNLIVGLGTKLIEGALKSPLRPETETATDRLVGDLNRTRNNW